MNTPSNPSSKDMEPQDDDIIPALASRVQNIPEDTNIVSQETFVTQKEVDNANLNLTEGEELMQDLSGWDMDLLEES